MEVIADKLPIHINGYEKYATGLTKRTTVDDVKYAILSVTESNFKLEDYAIFEKWQGNECMLDGKLKIYKLIRLWKSLPGDQLSKVKFTIKKRKANPVSGNNCGVESSKYNLAVQEHMKQQRKNSAKTTIHYYSEDFIRPPSALTKSPSANKTWNNQKAANALKRSSRKRDEPVQQASSTGTSSCEDNSDYESSASGEQDRYERRYSSIKRFNRSRKSTVRKAMMKQQFIDLVNKQNEIIDKQLNKIAQNEYLLDNLSRSESRKTQRSKSLDKFEAKLLAKKMKARDYSSSLRVKDDSQYKQPAQLPVEQCAVNNDISENDVRMVFDDILDDKQVKEYVSLCNNYFSLQNNVSQNRKRIDELNDEIKLMKCERELSSKLTHQSSKQMQKTSQKLQNSMDTYGKQNEKLENLSSALTRIDKIILLKTSLIQTLENELKTLENEPFVVDNNEEMVTRKLTTVLSTSSTASSLSSASSNVTSVSQQQQVQKSTNNPVHRVKNCMMTYVGDNDSDTGISSANSEDFGSTQLETLV